ncbi:MAG: hypothetical protein J5790_04710 [Bacteroidaceae bacterium]|nr:hypothetical protein [Bacteroidaceae bacterium]
MAIKVNARETELKIGKNPGYYYVMTPDLYIALKTQKVILGVIPNVDSHAVHTKTNPSFFFGCKV